MLGKVSITEVTCLSAYRYLHASDRFRDHTKMFGMIVSRARAGAGAAEQRDRWLEYAGNTAHSPCTGPANPGSPDRVRASKGPATEVRGRGWWHPGRAGLRGGAGEGFGAA